MSSPGRLVVRRRGNGAYLYHRHYDARKGGMVEEYCGKADRFATDATPRFEIRTCDFRDLGLEPGTVDLILTDPPYENSALGLWDPLGAFAARVLRSGGLLISYAGQHALPDVLAALRAHLEYVWTAAVVFRGSWRHSPVARVRNAFRVAVIFARPPFRAQGRHWSDVFISPRREKDLHPWEQNVGVARDMVRIFTDAGDLVVDPFAGSGTVAVAARGLGRGFVGCDVDPGAVATALSRVQAELGIPRPEGDGGAAGIATGGRP